MANAISFFPWWSIATELTIGPVRLTPYRRGKSPGDTQDVEQDHLDAVLAAYANHPRQRIKTATLLEVDDWRAGMDGDAVSNRLFAARDALGFSALSERQLFRGHFHYCCFDTFSLVVQSYLPGRPGHFSYATRRRDGGTRNLWASNEFAFQRPLHVHDHSYELLDPQLLTLLMDDVPSNWRHAVEEFNRANTDSPNVLPHVEVVMMKSAFEWLFQINPTHNQFCSALVATLADLQPDDLVEGPLSTRWSVAWPKSSRPLMAWAREFCALRGVSAHGTQRGNHHFVWSERAHLAFASLLFPLVFKKVAADAGRFTLNEVDRERLRRIDQYALYDPFAYGDESSPHPWSEIDGESRMEVIGRLAFAGLEEGLKSAAP